MHYDWHANSYINTFDVKDIKKSRQYINSECDNKVLNYSDIAHNNITDDIIGLYKTVEDFNGSNFEASYTNIFSLRPIIKTVNLYNYDIVKNYIMVINDRFINDNIITTRKENQMMNIEEIYEKSNRASKHERIRAIIEDLKEIKKKSVEHSTRTAIDIIIEELEFIIEEGRRRK